METWKPITGFECYEISDHGNVRSLITDKLRRFSRHKYGYLNVALRKPGESTKSFNLYVHRCVAQEFVPNPNGLPDVHHKDGNPSNNHASNLQWVTHKQNLQYAVDSRGGVHWAKGKKYATRHAGQLLAFDGERLLTFDNYKVAAVHFGKPPTTFASLISRSIREGWAAYGFTWRRTCPKSA